MDTRNCTGVLVSSTNKYNRKAKKKKTKTKKEEKFLLNKIVEEFVEGSFTFNKQANE